MTSGREMTMFPFSTVEVISCCGIASPAYAADIATSGCFSITGFGFPGRSFTYVNNASAKRPRATNVYAVFAPRPICLRCLIFSEGIVGVVSAAGICTPHLGQNLESRSISLEQEGHFIVLLDIYTLCATLK